MIRYLAVWTESRPPAGREEPESSRNTERTRTPAASLSRSPAEEEQQEVQTGGTSWLQLQHRQNRMFHLYLTRLQHAEHERYSCGEQLGAVVLRPDGAEL